MNMNELDEVLRIARVAAARVSAIYATPFTVELKGPNDPVTRADREANEIICEALAASFPGDGIIAEESVPSSEAEIASRVARERVWFVDPLDGTREFADRNGEFAVMIGLAVRGRAALGVVLMPVTGEALAGRVGAECFCEDAAGARRPMRVRDVSDPRDATMVVSRSHRPAIIAPLVERLGIRSVVPCGSVGVKVSRIVFGEADLYVHGGAGAKRWDTCGPEAVLVAAGGRFTDLAGEAIDYSSVDLKVRTGIVATNGALHDAVLAATR
jgi:3'(2'), 5'-bisphosphate nucleotidase